MADKRIPVYRLEQTGEHLPTLVRETSYAYATNVFNSPDIIDNFFRNIVGITNLFEEHLYMLCLNTKGRVQGLFEISHGAVASTLCAMQSVGIRLLLSGASSCIIVHNHPSGVTEPSKEDRNVSARIYDLCKMLDITMQDFIIMGDDYRSFYENGELKGA